MTRRGGNWKVLTGRIRSLMVLVLFLCFFLWSMPGVAMAADLPTGLVITDVVKDGAAYDVTLSWAEVAGATGYKTQLGGVPAGAPVTPTYVFQDVAAGEAVFGVCSVDGVGDSEYVTKTLTLGSVAGPLATIVSGVTAIGSMFLQNTLLVYVLALAVVGFVWARVSRAIRR